MRHLETPQRLQDSCDRTQAHTHSRDTVLTCCAGITEQSHAGFFSSSVKRVRVPFCSFAHQDLCWKKVLEMLFLLLLIYLVEFGVWARWCSHFALKPSHCYHRNRKHSVLGAYSLWNPVVSAQPQSIFLILIECTDVCLCLFAPKMFADVRMEKIDAQTDWKEVSEKCFMVNGIIRKWQERHLLLLQLGMKGS